MSLEREREFSCYLRTEKKKTAINKFMKEYDELKKESTEELNKNKKIRK